MPLRPCAGACDVAEDPELDGRQAWPIWDTMQPWGLRVCEAVPGYDVSRVGGADDPGMAHFSVWRVPGRKRLGHAGSCLDFCASAGPDLLRTTLPLTLDDGAPCGFWVPLDAQLRAQLAHYQRQLLGLQGRGLPVAARAPTRAGLLHLRALQALDGAQAGASQRQIAAVLFGVQAVRERWSEDGELRAQLRHLLRRAQGFMREGYRTLAGLAPRSDRACFAGGDPGADDEAEAAWDPFAPGDEPRP